MIYQQGATLAITLILLFTVTLLTVSAVQVSHMQEKMAANLQDKALSFDAAESALRAGEKWVMALGEEPVVSTTCSTFPCVQEAYQNVDLTAQSSSWWQANATSYSTQLSGISTSPAYIVEYLQFVPDTPGLGNSGNGSIGVHYYQVTARGTGASDSSVSILQSTIGRRF